MITDKELPALKERLRTIIKDELALASFSEDSDGDFLFHYERAPFLVIFDQADPSFVWLRRSNVYWISKPDDSALAQVDSCINEANLTCKLVKLCRTVEPNHDGDHMVMVSTSILVDDVAALSADTIERCLFQIKVGERQFRKRFEDATPAEVVQAARSTDVPVRH